MTVICFTVIANQTFGQTRYVDEMFTNVTVTSGVIYGNNLGVITGGPVPEDLLMDVYEPSGDVVAQRPLIIYVHTGSFLPKGLNQSTTGSLADSALVEMCTQFAKRGYVVAAMTYRLGWNPLDTTLVGRVSGLLNAAYRGIQDARNCVRFFNMDAQINGNTYGIDTTKIVMVGQGTGGYISNGVATLDKVSETELFKFLDQGGSSVVVQALSGDPYGMGGSVLNTENYPGYSSEIDMAINLGGALGDSSWLEAGDVPMVGMHCPNDPFAPYGYGMVIVPTTGENVVFVSGTHDAIRRANSLGNNAVLNNATFFDVHTQAANGDGSNVDNLFPIVRTNPESAPWEWWDPADINHANSVQTNLDMSATKGKTYIDTVMGYVNPRISCVLGLNPCGTVGTGNSLCTAPIASFTSTESSFTATFAGATTNNPNAIYDWDFGDGDTAIAQNPTHTYADTGTYNVCMTVNDYCGSDAVCMNVVITGLVGIASNLELTEFNVFPNPASSSVTISSSDMIKTVEIYDVTGRVILSIVDINSKEQLIEKGNLNEGLYFIRISTESSYSVETVMFE